MRLLAVSPLAEIYGGERVLLRVLPALRRRGYSVKLAVPSGGPLADAAAERGIPTVRIPLGPPDRLTPLALAGAAVAPAHLLGCDVVWLNGLPTQRLVPALALTGRPAVLRVNNPLREPPAWWRRQRFWRVVRAVSAPSAATAAECVAAGAPPASVHVIPPTGWEDGGRPAPVAGPGGGHVHVGFVGRIEPRKGVLELMQAADGFLSPHPEAVLTVIGEPLSEDDGYAARVRDLAAASRCHDRIRFRGYVPDAALEIARLDLLVLPSHAEPGATVVCEAAAAGVPVVASAVDGVSENVGQGGVLVPPGDPDRLAEAIAALVGDPVRRRQLAQNALAGAHRFDPSWAAEQMDRLLRHAVTASQ
ncbi:MAG TPA: glycosyltransferase family 4 protein [Solirubrobacteraceae bacterium]|nr:glycosyltransferase family 4 protein [Solirubrobacteraceae bacterium]